MRRNGKEGLEREKEEEHCFVWGFSFLYGTVDETQGCVQGKHSVNQAVFPTAKTSVSVMGGTSGQTDPLP